MRAWCGIVAGFAVVACGGGGTPAARAGGSAASGGIDAGVVGRVADAGATADAAAGAATPARDGGAGGTVALPIARMCTDVDAAGAIATRGAVARITLRSDRWGCSCGDRTTCDARLHGDRIEARVAIVPPLVSCAACLALTVECALPDVDAGDYRVIVGEEPAGVVHAAAAPATPRTERCVDFATTPPIEPAWLAASILAPTALCRDVWEHDHAHGECAWAQGTCGDGFVFTRARGLQPLCIPNEVQCRAIDQQLVRLARGAATPIVPGLRPGEAADCPAPPDGVDRRVLRSYRHGNDVALACGGSTAATIDSVLALVHDACPAAAAGDTTPTLGPMR